MEMTEEEMEFEAQQMQAFFRGGNQKAGQLVETKSGLLGRTYNNENLVNGKVRVYTDKGNLLCDPDTLKVKGFID